MESNGAPNSIHISQETAELLIAAGKSSWIQPREDKIFAKGKGELQTYWLAIGVRSDTAFQNDTRSESTYTVDHVHDVFPRRNSLSTDVSGEVDVATDDKTMRLVNWNVEVLSRLLKQIVARRSKMQTPSSKREPDKEFVIARKGQTVIDEVKEIINLPCFDAKSASRRQSIDAFELEPRIFDELRSFVTNVSFMYKDNPFHNFEHASHVTMSVVKLLNRIVAPSDYDFAEGLTADELHDHTYGITSDPLTQFACVWSALIHDLDHPGVPNTQLIKEESQLASAYKNKSIAEQNSVDLAWALLMDQKYESLRATIYSDDTELKRFRQLVVNSVMATDIVDAELKALRNARWEKAFCVKSQDNSQQSVDRKATIVIEHLIQASDVAHTMQHWHIYRKWNERFFMECYKAYLDRAEKDPSDTWYKGEIGFFDFYIIPLAKKLKDCGVFGVSSDEYLNYAMKNRQEWEDRGMGVVSEMIDIANHELRLRKKCDEWLEHGEGSSQDFENYRVDA
jgi:hypothetical protein